MVVQACGTADSSEVARSLALSKPLGWLAAAAAALGIAPPTWSALRTLLSFGYLEHYVVSMAWHVLSSSLFLGVFIWLHLTWRANALLFPVGVLGAVVAVLALLAGVLVWIGAPDFWIVWPTYGQDFQYGLCLWAVAAHPAGRPRSVAITATTGGLVLLLPASVSESMIGLSAIASFCVFLWLLGSLPLLPSRSSTLLRAPLVMYLVHLISTPSATSFVAYCLAALLLSEARAFLDPPAASDASTALRPP